jgi:hypothetical protein
MPGGAPLSGRQMQKMFSKQGEQQNGRRHSEVV